MTGTTTEPPKGEGTQPKRPRRPGRLAPREWTRTGIRIFSSGTDAPRARRPTDIVLLILAVIGIVASVALAPGPRAFDKSLTKLVTELPGLGGWFWEISYDLLIGWALVLMVGTAVARGRKGLLADELFAILLSFGIAVVAGWVAGSTLSEMIHGLGRSNAPAVYPAMRLAVATAVLVTASPHLARPLRYTGRWVLAFGGIAAVALGIAIPLGVLTGFAVGVAAAAVVHLLRGSPGGRPTLEQVAETLRGFDVEAVDLRYAPLEPRGVALVTGSTRDRRALTIKIYGRDAWEGQFFGAAWLRLWHRDDEQRVGLSRQQSVEHEAFMTLFAERGGVAVQPVVAAGAADDGDAVLVVETIGPPLGASDPSGLTEPTLRALWETLGDLHALGIAHGQIDGDRVVISRDGSPALTSFGRASMGASDAAMLTDRARLLVATALVVGPERALSASAHAIGRDGLGEILPYLQPAVLELSMRKDIRGTDWDVDDLRARASEVAGVEPPKLEQIRRVTVRSILVVIVIGLIAYSLISLFAGIGLQAILDELKGAKVGWLVAALVLFPLAAVGQALALIGACFADLRFTSVLMLEYAIQFIQLALPSSAARIALQVRFLQRNGVEPGPAVSIGAIAGVSNFLVQVVFILVITLSGLASLDLSAASPSSSGASSSSSSALDIVILAVVLLLLGVIVGLAVPRYRNTIVESIRRYRAAFRAQISASLTALRVLRSPKRLGMIFGGSVFTQIVQAVVLGLCVEAFGYHVSLAGLILVNTSVSIFAGFMPVPGGMGVAEAGYTAGLAGLGIPHSVALATAIAFRLVSFYLPPIWGTFAMRWLHRHEYV